MSFSNMTGWFIVASSNPKIPDSVAYRCTDCGIDYLFGDDKPRAYCCGQFKDMPKMGWFRKLPRVKAEPARGALVLPGRVIDFGNA